MDIELYMKPRTNVQRFYYNYLQKHGRGSFFLPEAHEFCSPYLANYELVSGMLRHIYPFSFLESGDIAVMVGSHDGFIELGLSQTCISSAIVGDTGLVQVIDCDPRNIQALQKYAIENKVNNVKALHRGVWSESGDMEFLFFSDFSSSNTIMSVAETKMEMWKNRWGNDRLENSTYRETVRVDTIDNILKETDLFGEIDFLNLTLNGAEIPAIKGAMDTISSSRLRAISFPLQSETAEACRILSENNFTITAADAPTKAWDQEPFLYACATRISTEEILYKGFLKTKLHLCKDLVEGYKIIS
jgi:FkbM family methyltransferase